MNARVIGDRRLVAGFALAGIDGRVCATRAEVEASLDEASFLIFSDSAAALIPDRIAEWQRSGNGPFFVVVPASLCSGVRPRPPAGEAPAAPPETRPC